MKKGGKKGSEGNNDNSDHDNITSHVGGVGEEEKSEKKSSEGGSGVLSSESDNDSVVEGTQMVEAIKKYSYNGKQASEEDLKRMEELACDELKNAGTQFNLEHLVNHFSETMV